MNNEDLISILREHYDCNIQSLALFREGGNATYTVESSQTRYFLKCVGRAFSDTLLTSIEVNQFLYSKGVAVPRILLTAEQSSPYIVCGDHILVLYEYLDTTEIDMERDAEAVGAVLGQMHQTMETYQGKLVSRDKGFYVDRYLNILRAKEYKRVDEFEAYGDRLWKRVRDLPFGYSHGDLYSGNVERGKDQRLYILDFDTSCLGFPLYDLALVCNQTDYFQYDEGGLERTIAVFERLRTEYVKSHPLAACNARSLCDLLALYHYALQATIIEIHGLNCVDNAFLDRQLEWLLRWEQQCAVFFHNSSSDTSNNLLTLDPN